MKLIVTIHAVGRSIERYPEKFKNCGNNFGLKRKYAEMYAKYSFLKDVKPDGSRIRIGNGIKFVERDGIIKTCIK